MIDDESQKTAIFHPLDKSLFITAPAGYGKTYVMTERIKYILSSNAISPPKKMLALTFSNSAANEMINRVNANIRNVTNYLDIMNFHTFSYKFLKVYGNYIGLKRNFSIVSEQEKNDFKQKYFENLIASKKVDSSVSIYDLYSIYNSWYNKRFLQKKEYSIKYDKLFNDLNEKLKKEFINEENLDFDHLLFKSIELLEENKKLKDLFFNKYKFILADEFQDTNFIQYCLLKELSINSKGEKRNVFVVGDKKQAIMRFQGANPENIDLLIKDFNCNKLELKTNHRTDSKKIISISNQLRGIESDIDENIYYKMFINDIVNDENSRIIYVVNSLIKKHIKPHNICILFPQIRSANLLKKTLLENSIDFIFVNDFKYDSIEYQYSKIFSQIKEMIDKKINNKSVYHIIKNLILTHYKDQYENNVILNSIENFSRKFDYGIYSNMEVWKRLQEFYNCLQMEIDWIDLIKSKIKNKIFLSTIHGSKGLEFDYIIMFGIVNFRLPHHSKCIPCSDFNKNEKCDITEAIDLFYVGVTRTIKDIVFMYSKQDEQNLSKTTRKISCVFIPLQKNIKFFDINNKEYNYLDTEIIQRICTPR